MSKSKYLNETGLSQLVTLMQEDTDNRIELALEDVIYTGGDSSEDVENLPYLDAETFGGQPPDYYASKEELATASVDANSYTDTAITNLINGAPESLDTLKELADAMDENADVIDALNTLVGEKANQDDFKAHIDDADIHHTHENKSVLDTTTANYTSEEKTKLSGIDVGANAYTHPTYTSRTGVPTANQTPGFGGTFTVTQPTSDGTGHITAMTSRTVTIPNTAATTSSAGLMSAADKTKLDSVASGANAYTHPNSGVTAGTYQSVTVNAQGHVTAGSNPTLPVAQGGTGATTAAAARTNLGVAYGTAAGTVCQGNDSRLSNARTPTAHNQAASTITAGTLAGAVVANATAVATLGTKQTRNIYAGTTDMTAGTTALPAGDIYVFYES